MHGFLKVNTFLIRSFCVFNFHSNCIYINILSRGFLWIVWFFLTSWCVFPFSSYLASSLKCGGGRSLDREESKGWLEILIHRVSLLIQWAFLPHLQGPISNTWPDKATLSFTHTPFCNKFKSFIPLSSSPLLFLTFSPSFCTHRDGAHRLRLSLWHFF